MIGVIGLGVVGDAVREGFERKGLEVGKYDPYKLPGSVIEDVTSADVVFVCVPTPTLPARGQDLRALQDALGRLEDAKYQGVVAVKSTTLPENLQALAKEHDVRIVANPEFLRANSAKRDFFEQAFIVLGGDPLDVEALSRLYTEHWPYAKQFRLSLVEAMVVKYAINCGLASRVLLMNQIVQSHDMANIPLDWSKVVEAVSADPRTGSSHMDVPGHDGPGIAGACFPKDMSALGDFMRRTIGRNLCLEGMAYNRCIRQEQ